MTDILKYFLLFGILGIIYCIIKKIGDNHTIIWFGFPFFLILLGEKNIREQLKLYSIQYLIAIFIIIILMFLSFNNKLNKNSIKIITILWVLLALFQSLYSKNKK